MSSVGFRHAPVRNILSSLILVGLSLPALAAGSATTSYVSYVPVDGLVGDLSSVGSDTLENLTLLWAEQFKSYYPDISIRIQASGSATAPPALLDGSATLAPMSRLMSDTEVAAFEEKFGFKPTPVAVAIDALAVYVNKDNPVTGLTVPDVDAIFSRTRACGGPVSIDTWFEDRAIVLYGRNVISGTHLYFRQHALCEGEFKESLVEKPGSASVVRAVGAAANSIGYSGIGYSTPAVRAVPLARIAGKPYVEATADNALDGSYPLARLLYVYISKDPNQVMNEVARQFIKMALSAEGQQMVSRAGYISLPASAALRESNKLGQLPGTGH